MRGFAREAESGIQGQTGSRDREEDWNVEDETTGHGRWVGVTAERQADATQWWALCTALEQILAQVNGYLD